MTTVTGVVEKRGRPARLSIERILAVAVTKHPERLTMQSLAAELDVAPSALYRWVRDREELLELVSAELTRRIELTERPTKDNWREWLIEQAYRMREGYLELPGLAQRVLSGPHRHTGPSSIEEGVVEAFVFGGASPESARQYWYVYCSAITGWVAAEQNEHYQPATPPDFPVLVDVLLRGTSLGCAGTDQGGKQ